MGRKEPSLALQDRAYAELSHIRYNSSFRLPATPTHPEGLRVTYADVGYASPYETDDGRPYPTVLFLGGMMGGRGCMIHAHEVAKKHRVRIICTDRPGMGGSERIPLQERISNWLETVPFLLNHLGIKHISLASHSGGAIYLVNTLLKLRQYLDPRMPYVTFFSPWVHQQHSGVVIMNMTEIFPAQWIGGFHKFTSFFNANIAPAIGFSTGIVESMNPLWSSSTPAGAKAKEQHNEALAGPFEYKDFKDALEMKYRFAEDISGSSDDALIFLRRTGDSAAWGEWRDYDTYVPLLATREKELRKPNEPRLKIDVFHAEDDRLIGPKGARWFDACWKTVQEEGEVDFSSKICPGTQHDGILGLRYGVLEPWLASINTMHEESVKGVGKPRQSQVES